MVHKLLEHCGVVSEDFKESFPENYYPIPENYIVFISGSERPSQSYRHYFEVVGRINKTLKENEIVSVQAGDKTDVIVPGTLDLRGRMSPRQLAHLIKCAKVCITSNMFAAKLSRIYNVPLVLIGTNFPTKLMLSSFKNCTYIEPNLNGKKWNYKVTDPENTVNGIKPEVISDAILQKLNISHDPFSETVFAGKHYGIELFDFVPDSQFPQHLADKTVNLRLDLYYSREAVEQLSSFCKLNIVTKESFDINRVNTSNILSITYFCNKTANYDFIKDCKAKGINIMIFCSSDEHIQDIRFDLLGIAEVHKQRIENPLDKLDICATMFRSSRVVFGRNKVYSSIYHYKRDLQGDLMATELPKVLDDDFLEFTDFMFVFKP